MERGLFSALSPLSVSVTVQPANTRISGTTLNPRAPRGLPIFNRDVPRNHTLSWPDHWYKLDWRRKRRLVPGGSPLKKVEKGRKDENFLFLHFLVNLRRSFFFSFSYSRRSLGHDGGEKGVRRCHLGLSCLCVICKGGSVNLGGKIGSRTHTQIIRSQAVHPSPHLHAWSLPYVVSSSYALLLL